MKMQSRSRGLRELCRLLGYSPQAYYQYQKTSCRKALEEDLLIAQVLHQRILQPKVGGKKLLDMMEDFMRDHQITAGRDRFFDLLRENGLLCRKRRRSRPRTTDSNHWMKKYPNLTGGFIPDRANALWMSDITYIRLRNAKFAYLSLVTDAYSRKIAGFCLHHNLSAQGPLTALEMALKTRTGNGPLIHHSDRGSQYCSDDYVRLLSSAGIHISMTQSGNPKDNAIAERVNGILKQELLEAVYPDIIHARQAVITAVDIYNRIRLHSSVDMLTPQEAHQQTGPLKRWWKSRSERNVSRQAI